MDARRRVPLGALWRGDVDERPASLDADNKIADWQYELWSNTHSMRPESTNGTNVLAAWYMAEPQMHGPPQGIPQPAGGGDRNAVPLYDFPNQKIVHHFIPQMPIRVSALRTLGGYANVFAMESFMDEMAALAKADPVAFRLAHMKDPRARDVIEKVAAIANWKPGEAGSLSRGRGIGFSKYKNLACYVACIADVEVDRATGKVRVSHVWSATDSGLVINPDGLKKQIEGGIIQSASWTLYEQVQFDKTGITSRDWASYPIMTMPDVPKVTVELINRPNERPLGAGEGSQGPGGRGDRQRRGARDRQTPARPAARRGTGEGCARLICHSGARATAREPENPEKQGIPMLLDSGFGPSGRPGMTAGAWGAARVLRHGSACMIART